uniref:WD_REPEATS_REGION domain-containing protein n=1 Tax=Trichobilharzia regenti TaxID=157069 RepID=A0AA85KKI3_TRIRE
GLCEHTFLGHTHSINHAIFNQQGTYVISCDTGGFIRLWDLRKLNNFTFGINLPSVTKGTQLSTTANTTTNNNTHNSNSSINEDETKTLPTLFDLNKCSRKPDQSRRHRHNRTQIPGKQQHSEHQPHSDQQYQHRQQSNKVGVNQLVVDLSGEYILAACDDSKIYCIEISTSQ